MLKVVVFMKNIYLFFGDSGLIKKEINEIILKEKIDENNKTEYNLENTALNDVLEDAMIISMFGGKKLIIVNNAFIFESTKTEIDLNFLEKYFDNYNKDTILIFITNEKIDERKKIVKKIKEIGEVKSFVIKNDNDIYSYLNNYIKKEGYTITNNSLRLLIKLVGTNVLNLEQEINKLMLYKENDKKIEEVDIKEIVSKNMEEEIFSLIDAITNKNIKKALDLYNEFIIRNEEPIKIIALLGNKFRLIYQAKKYYNMGYNKDLIAKNLEVHPYPVSLAIDLSYNYSYSELLNILSDLANLDKDIKLGNCNKYNALELFLIKVC